MSEHYQRLPLHCLAADPDQPRIELERADEALTEAHTLWGLAQSIREVGILQPIRVQPIPEQPGQYRIISGQRRFEAAKLAGLEDIPCLIDEAPGNAQTVLLAQVSENLQRKAFTANELAMAIASLRQGGESRDAIAKKLGIQASQVTLLLSLLQLNAPIKAAFDRGRIESPRAAYDLNKLPEALQEALIHEVDSRGRVLTQRDVREARLAQRYQGAEQLHRYEAPLLTSAEFQAVREVLAEVDDASDYVPDTDRDAVFGPDWRSLGQQTVAEAVPARPVDPSGVPIPSIQLTSAQAERVLARLAPPARLAELAQLPPKALGQAIASLLAEL